MNCSRNNTLSLICFINLTIEYFFFSCHCISFSWTCLSICKDSCTISLDCCVKQFIYAWIFITHLLTEVLIKQIVEFISFENTSTCKFMYLWFICKIPSFSNFKQLESPRLFYSSFMGRTRTATRTFSDLDSEVIVIWVGI